LNARLGALLSDRDLALELGARAQRAALELFSVSRFTSAWQVALEAAHRTFERR
jgi:hypothetical protein